MSFRLTCPNCGPRQVGEYAFRGEYRRRPKPDDDFSRWTDYVYMRRNPKGINLEWWYHRNGCQRWFLVLRDTADNQNHQSFWFEDRHRFAGEHLGTSETTSETPGDGVGDALPQDKPGGDLSLPPPT